MRPLTRIGNYISSRIGKAIADYKLVEDKDRILVAVSGGKDSLSLLKLLNERKAWAPIEYTLIAAHIETDFRCAGCVHTKQLSDFFEKNKTEYHIEKIHVLEGKERTSCFWCSWNRRKALFTMADKLGCNKVAFGHHMDDIVETLLLNLFYHGNFSAMNPRQELFGGKLTIIRPLCYVEENNIKKFAEESGFPSQMCRCPNAQISKRRFIKGIIADVGKDNDRVKLNLFRSMSRINREYIQVGRDPDIFNDEIKLNMGGGEINGRESSEGWH